MTSLWLDRDRQIADEALPADGAYDDLVVGAGLTGLVTALLLARAGRRVGVLEATGVGAITTGHTTAKISLLQGTKLSRVRRHQPRSIAEAYLDANREGQQWLLRFCRDHDVEVQSRPAVTFAASAAEVNAVRDEHLACQELGLPTQWAESLDVPFPCVAATVLDDQAQFDPLDALAALVAELRQHGGTLHLGHRVVGVSKSGRPQVELADGTTLRADHVVLATGAPILDRGLHFARVEPKRSYAIAFAGAQPPEAMYLSAGHSTRSIRDVPTPGGPLLLVGGSGHTVGRTESEHGHVQELREWTAKHFTGAVETHSWSAQDYSPHDEIPFVGPLPLADGRVYVATGFDKWGMTNGVAAALHLSGEILGGSAASGVGRRAAGIRSAAKLLQVNAGVAAAGVRALLGAELRPAPRDVPVGTGTVGRSGGLPTAVSNESGDTQRHLGVCTHLGGALRWNDAECTWDCPLHGSRFAPDGSVIEGPATKPLRPR